MRTMLKICGLMRGEDVALCCDKGVEICGFVTEYPIPVPWNLSRERCRQLLPLVCGKTKSCIVTGGPLDKLRKLAFNLHPDYVQLHGGESIGVTATLVTDLARLGIQVIKTVPATAKARLREFGTTDPARCAQMLDDAGVFAALVDARGPENAANTGLQVDQGVFRAVQQAARCLTVLGGGVRSNNCRKLIERLHPAALDVMTGVELAPGIKSEAMLNALLKAMEEAKQSTDRSVRCCLHKDGKDDKGNTAQFDKSGWRENLGPQKGTFSQEYLMYFKKK